MVSALRRLTFSTDSVQWLTLQAVARNHGTAARSPVSLAIAEIVMQTIEKRALATYRQTIPLSVRYFDDIITTLYTKTNLKLFTTTIANKKADIQLTKEIELDTLV